MVPEAGLEPAHISILDFESSASTNFTTQARINLRVGSVQKKSLKLSKTEILSFLRDEITLLQQRL